MIIDIESWDRWNELAYKDNPTIADFWASWCSPCLKQGEILEEIAREFPHITILKVNIEETPQIAKTYNIRSIPTLIVRMPNEQEEFLHGLHDKESILSYFDLV